MLAFFRKYQKYFFIVITFIIIISFSFFGTYSTLISNPIKDTTAFTAVDGTAISRSEVDEMALFIGTDNDDKMLLGGVWGPNFLNDGVVKKNFLATGMAEILVRQYRDELGDELQSKLEKEKRYPLYVHPQAKFLNTQGAWNYFAPDLKTNYEALKGMQNPLDSNAFEARVRLYLAEKQFPASLLRQVLRYQERQYPWIQPDPTLDRIDLSLFGYHSTEDWFGKRFVRLISEFVINAAKIAEQKGYHVSSEETLADLMRNSQISFQQNKTNPQLGVASRDEYYNEQLRRLGMDQNRAIKIWKQVLLFRRLFQDMGNSVFVDPLVYQLFNSYAKEFVDVVLYRLPEPLRLGNFNAMQKLEVYLDSVAKKPRKENDLLGLPIDFLSIDEVAQRAPELVQKRYLLEIAQVSKKNLQTKVGVKETWNWEVSDKNWSLLKKEFPDLGIKKAETQEERLAALDALDDSTRAKVDAFTRAAIVNTHPEWMKETLAHSAIKKEIVGLRTKGGTIPIVGLKEKDVEEFMQLLDQALGQNPAAVQAQEKLSFYTADSNNYYQIKVLDKAPQSEILTFAEANLDGTLDQLLNQKLESYYTQIRDKDPQLFQKADGTPKPLKDVQDLVASRYFEKILNAIRDDYASANANEKSNVQQLNNDLLASYRLYFFMREVENRAKKDPSALLELAKEPKEAVIESKLTVSEPLKGQWKLEATSHHTDRSEDSGISFNKEEAFSLPIQSWSKVHLVPNGDIAFFQLLNKGNGTEAQVIGEKIEVAQQFLSADAQRLLMDHALEIIRTKKAISLDYLDQNNPYGSIEQQEG